MHVISLFPLGAVLAACAVFRYGLLARGSTWECGKREALPCRAPAGSQFTSGKVWPWVYVTWGDRRRCEWLIHQ